MSSESAAIKDDVLERFQLIRNDPWEFLKAVRTLDPSDKVNPIKQFPTNLEYIKLYIRVWQKEPHLLVPKSRRMKMSWLNIILYTWDSMFHTGRHNAFVSKKEDDSNEIIKKAQFIIENLNPDIIPKGLIPKYEVVFNRINFPEIHSVIQGFPSGADQLRQFTFSGILADEMAFWDNAEQMYSASIPTLEGGGKFTALSSAAPGFFKHMVNDDMNFLDETPTRANLKYPMKGIELWKNPKNGFTVIQIHYSADPNKTPEYMAHIKNSMPKRRWDQEYEIQWDSFEGLPVFPDWNSEIHGVKSEILPKIGLPLLLGVDFGMTPAMIVCQMQEDILYVLREFTAFNMGAERFMKWVTPQLKMHYPMWADSHKDYMVFIDPSGTFRKDTDESTCAMVIAKNGYKNIIPGAISWEERRTAVEHYLTRRTKTGSAIQVSIPNCPLLVRGFLGGYRYSDKVIDNEPNKVRPIKDEHSHIADALQMVVSKMIMQRGRFQVTVPRPNYSWSSNQ